ncbi:nucleoside phosphatase family protein [Klebsormidium nitens]|uniref:Nucleoside phosphatase family protein n=1 Tax=Klebsormidium nitens TaxID=105231 RepID=A0A0U9HJY3_KLENI|nr:nucleoside phosphatase family protein [Klebsormidium nitens]|eukprot:GAQ83030.1 nucleoside phosphatase family protein [Klebsormidium nitens]
MEPLPRWRSRASFLFTFILIALSLLYLSTFSYASRVTLEGTEAIGYGIVIDAGSSGCRLHVYKYTAGRPVPQIFPADLSLKIRPGLSSFADNPSAAGASLTQLMEFARENVPASKRAETPIFLMATAGLRRVEASVAEEILESCRKVLAGSGFMFRPDWASVISGTFEGVYAWVAANYALGNLGMPAAETTGVVELGGASAQVTFVPEVAPPPEFRHDLQLGGHEYILYTHSFLNFGQEAAMDGVLADLLAGNVKPGEVVEALEEELASADVSKRPRGSALVDPCRPKGYLWKAEELALKAAAAALSAKGDDAGKERALEVLEAAGNFTECRAAAVSLFKKGSDACAFAKCPIGGAYVPELKGNFFATENFFYTSEFFKLPATSTLTEIAAAGEAFCSADWLALQKLHEGVSEQDLLKYCFSAAYITALLHDGLGLPMDTTKVRFTNFVGSTPVDWALGAIIYQLSNGIGVQPPSGGRLGGPSFLAVFAVLGGVGLAVFAFRTLRAYRRSTVTTIYDLEKGRYILTPNRSFYKA